MQKQTNTSKIDTVSIFEQYPRLIGVLLIFFFLGLLDLIAGIFLIPENYQSFRIRDSFYHHGIQPESDVITNWGQKYYKFSSNSLGFRDRSTRKVSLLPEGNSRRILFMGDSHTEAVGVEYSDSFVGRLEEMVRNENIEILNGSAVSYSPRIHYLKTKYLIEEKGLRIDELFVVIDMSDLNNEIAYEGFEPKINPGYVRAGRRLTQELSKYSAIVFLADKIIKERRNRFFYRNMPVTDRSDFELYATFFSDFKDADLLNDPNFHHVSRWIEDDSLKGLAEYSLDVGQKNIAQLNDLCRKHDIEMTITVHPWQDQVIKGDTTNAYVESWRTFADQQNIGFINLYPVFINHTNPVITASQCYIKYDNHWNERGHALVAAAFLPHILAKNR
ncbi:MAG: hypothetical protein WD577_09645 [Bacteroidales bacterium]